VSITHRIDLASVAMPATWPGIVEEECIVNLVKLSVLALAAPIVAVVVIFTVAVAAAAQAARAPSSVNPVERLWARP